MCVCASEGHFKLADCIVQATLARRTRHDTTEGGKKKGGDDELAGYVQAALAIQALSFPTRARPYFDYLMGDGMDELSCHEDGVFVEVWASGWQAWRCFPRPHPRQLRGYPRRGHVST